MDLLSIFAVITGVIILGFIAELIFKKTNISDVLLLIFVGIILGTYFNWVSPETFGSGASLFTTFALIFILFQGALNIDFNLDENKKPIISNDLDIRNLLNLLSKNFVEEIESGELYISSHKEKAKK